MALHDSEGLHMTYDFMRPGKVKVVTLIHLIIISRQQYKLQQWGKYRIPQNVFLFI